MSFESHYFKIDKARFEEVLDFLPYPFLIAESRNGVYHNLYVNQRFLGEIGYSCDEIPTIEDWFRVGYPDPLYRAEIISKWNERYLDAKRFGRNSAELRVKITTKNLGERWYEVKSSIFSGVQLVAFVSIHEIQSKEEELRKLNEHKNQILSVLSHDLRAPLNTLHAITLLASSGRLAPDEFLDLVRTVNERTRQTLDLLDTTLMWAKSNFESIMIKREETCIEDVVQSILQICEYSYSKKGIRVIVSLEKEDPVTDPELMAIIIRNLISNAIKFTVEGGTISISSLWKDNVYHLSIQDSGIGMSRELIDSILRSKYISSKGTHFEEGHGIGLKLCQQLLNKINGRLEIESSPGKGTTMQVII